MKGIKRIFIFLTAITLIMPHINCLKVKAAEDGSVKIGDKYEKKIVVVNEPEGIENKDFIEKRFFMNKKYYAQVFNGTDEDDISDKTEELLIPKTNANYEIALSYEDGDYTYAGTADTYEEAVQKAEAEKQKVKLVSDTLVVPVVLNTEKQTFSYATDSIARCIKKYNGGSDPNYRVCNVFKDQGLTELDRAIHEDCCSEMPLLSETETEARVYINGCSGWMNMNDNRTDINENGKKSSDVTIQPVTDVKNPSFYCVKSDGLLYHYISTKMDGEEVNINTDDSKKIGKAPSYLKIGVKYLSYDGKHFYSTENRSIPNTLIVLTDDLKQDRFNNAVNPDSSYYNYYLYLPFRSRTNYTAEELNRYINYFIKANGYNKSALEGIGDSLIKNQDKYGVNALLTLSIAINESKGGTSDYALNRNNLFGLNATDYNTDKNTSKFESVDDCIESFCKTYISKWFADATNSSFYGGYLGNKGYGANAKYASDPYWADKAANNACKIENYLNDFKPNNYKDYDFYQLFKFTKAGSVKDVSGADKYNVNKEFIPKSGEFVGSTGLLLCNDTLDLDGISYNEIALDMTLNGDNINNGFYKWSSKGYVNTKSIELINKGKTYTDKADLNKNGHVDTEDLAKEASLYNASGSDLNYMFDLNDDGIIDIYDLVKLSSRL